MHSVVFGLLVLDMIILPLIRTLLLLDTTCASMWLYKIVGNRKHSGCSQISGISVHCNANSEAVIVLSLVATSMVTFYEANGFDEFVKTVENLKEKSEPIFVYFAGSHDKDGKSWCPDCEEAFPVVEEIVKTSAPKNSHFVYVQVGDRETWKDRRCIFRINPLTRLSMLPTLQRWGAPYILKEDECKSSSLIQMLLEEEP